MHVEVLVLECTSPPAERRRAANSGAMHQLMMPEDANPDLLGHIGRPARPPRGPHAKGRPPGRLMLPRLARAAPRVTSRVPAFPARASQPRHPSAAAAGRAPWRAPCAPAAREAIGSHQKQSAHHQHLRERALRTLATALAPLLPASPSRASSASTRLASSMTALTCGW